MDKKPLIAVSILAVVLLVLGSLSNVVGYQLVKSTVNDSPLFQTRTQRASFDSSEKTNYQSENGYLYIIFGLIIIDGVITNVGQQGDYRFYFECHPVEKVTVIGIANIGDYYHPIRLHFYMKTFTDATAVSGTSHRILWADEESQHFSVFVAPIPYTGVSVWFI